MSKTLTLLILFVAALTLATSTAPPSVYLVQVNLDPTTLTELYDTKQTVLIAQQAPPGCWSSVWGSIATPFAHNYLVWNETGTSVYASTSAFGEGHPIHVGAFRRSVQPQYGYEFKDGEFGSQVYQEWLEEDQLTINNLETDVYYFGLAQDISVNSAEIAMPPLYSCEMMGMEYEVFTPSPSFYIFLGGRTTAPGTMTRDLRRVARSALTLVRFDPDTTKINLTWNREVGRFVVE